MLKIFIVQNQSMLTVSIDITYSVACNKGITDLSLRTGKKSTITRNEKYFPLVTGYKFFPSLDQLSDRDAHNINSFEKDGGDPSKLS